MRRRATLPPLSPLTLGVLAALALARGVWLAYHPAPAPLVSSAFFGFIIAIISAVASALGAAGGAIATASLAVINWLTTSVGWITRRLADTVRATGGVFSRTWSALRGLWSNVVRPALRQLVTWTKQLRAWLTQKLAPVFRLLSRVRERIRAIYTNVLKPILDAIETTRYVLQVLAKLHVPFAKALDGYLAQAEAAITENYIRLLGYVNKITDTLNAIVTGDLLFQRVPFLRSLKRDAPEWIKMWWNGQLAAGATPAPGLRSAEKLRYLDPQYFGHQLGTFYRDGGGDYADQIRELVPEWKKAAGLSVPDGS
jgi:hypothetical protein